MLVWRLLVLVAVAVGGVGAVAPTAGAAPPTEINIDLPGAGPLGPIGVIGDSVTLGTAAWQANDLAERGWGPVRFHSSVGTRIAEDREFHALSTVRRWRGEGFDPRHVIIGLGQNDVGFTQLDVAGAKVLIERMLDELGPNTEVLWVNITHFWREWAQAWNQALAEVAAVRPNLVVSDWASVAVDHPEWVEGDNIHLTAAAYRQRSLLIADASLDLVRAERVTGPPVLATAPVGAPAGLIPLDPVRVVDTRVAVGGTRLPAGGTLTVDVSGMVPDGATAAAVNLTVDQPAADGYLSAWDCAGSAPSTSVLNYRAGAPRGGHTVVGLGSDRRFCVTSLAATDVVVDVFGAFMPGGGARFRPAVATRLLDTRATGRPAAGTVTKVTVPAVDGEVALAAAVNLTSTDPARDGYVTAFPCGSSPPPVSNLNHGARGSVANLALVKLGPGGELCLTTYASTDVVVDLLGTYGSGGLQYQAAAPVRALDTRTGAGGWRGLAMRLDALDVDAATVAGLPVNAQALAGTLTAAGAAAPGFVTTWPCAQPRPTASTLNVERGGTVPNAAIVGLGADRRLCLASYAPTFVLFDLTGWYA